MDQLNIQTASRAVTAGDAAFRELADFAPVMIWRAGADTLCDWFNKPWLAFVGRSMEEAAGLGWADGIHPDDHERCIAIYAAAFAAREPFSMDYRRRRHDGEYRWLLDHGAPFDRDGRFAGYFGSRVDVTGHKRAQEHQRMMVAELDHRVKNALSIVQSLAQQSFRGAAPGPAAAQAFEARLQAFASAHDLLARESWHAASLEEMLTKILGPWCGGGRCEIAGPSVKLPPRSAVTFAIAMHELCMNAVKFGALSNEEGWLRVTWSVRAGPAPQFALDWCEEGGPAVTEPSQRGFGFRVVKRALAAELQADIAMTFHPGGLVCSIRAPLPNEAILAAVP